METSETLIEVKNVCQEFHLTKGLLQSLRFEKGKLVKEDKVVHAVNDVSFEIKKGEVFTEENLTVKRPGNGISPMKWTELLNTKAARDYDTDELI